MYVGQAIESVLSQEDDRCELIVVDDGSTDDSWSVISRYAVTQSFRLQNGGAAKACHFAVERSRAPFILFLDADDRLAPGSVARIIAHLDDGVAKLQFPLWPVDEAGRTLGPPSPRLPDRRECETLKNEVLRTGAYESPPTSGNVFARALCELLADVDYEGSVDGVLLFAAPFFGDIVSLSDPLGSYRLHALNFSQAGSRPTARRFGAEADRFIARHQHLGRVLRDRDHSLVLVDGHQAFFYRERRLYEVILEGRRPSSADILALIVQALGLNRSAAYRRNMVMFLILCACLPDRSRRSLLGYRVKPERRSAWGVIRHLLAGGSPVQADAGR